MIFAPLSELYGRVYVYHACNLCFIAFHVACALAPSLGLLIAFRFFAGFFGSCPTTNGGASIGDLVRQDRRGAFMGAFAVGPILGPVIGPVAGGFLSEAAGWRWVFWLVTIIAGVVSLVFLALADETYAPVLLQRKVDRLRREEARQGLHRHLRHEFDRGITPAQLIKLNVVRPLKLLLLSPIGIVCAFYMMVVYGYLYLMFTSITQVFMETYGFSANIASLTYLGVGIGSIVGIAIVSMTSDRLVKKQMATTGGVARPEARLQILPLGSVLLPAGLFIYGWTAEYKAHWISPIIGMSLIGIGNIVIFMSVVMYLVDSFTIYSASALAANTLFRSIVSSTTPDHLPRNGEPLTT